jgi:hypothetical protein
LNANVLAASNFTVSSAGTVLTINGFKDLDALGTKYEIIIKPSAFIRGSVDAPRTDAFAVTVSS